MVRIRPSQARDPLTSQTTVNTRQVQEIAASPSAAAANTTGHISFHHLFGKRSRHPDLSGVERGITRLRQMSFFRGLAKSPASTAALHNPAAGEPTSIPDQVVEDAAPPIAGAAQGITYLRQMSLFRELHKSSAMTAALDKLAAGEPTSMPVMWGFRAYKPGRELLAREINTLNAIAADVQTLKDRKLNVNAPLILADLHAEHNNVPPKAVPRNKGGVGNEGYEAYYDKVAQEAAKRGIQTVKLSDIFARLELTPALVADRGAELIRMRGDDADVPAEKATGYLTQDDIETYKLQAWNMVRRYETVPANQRIIGSGPAEKDRALEEKALSYIRFRKGEGDLLLPRLHEYFPEDNVIPIHVADPAAGAIGVEGLYIHARGRKNNNSIHIPWKGVDKDPGVVINQGRFNEAEVAAAKLVTGALRLKYGPYFKAAVRVAVRLSNQGFTGDALLKEARRVLAYEETVKHFESRIDKLKIAQDVAKKLHLTGKALKQEVRERVAQEVKMAIARQAGRESKEYAEREAVLVLGEVEKYWGSMSNLFPEEVEKSHEYLANLPAEELEKYRNP